MSRWDPESRTWHGPSQPPIVNPQASLGQVVLNLLERTPDKVFQICADTEEVYTCGQVRNLAIHVALNLQKKYGLKKGDVVSMIVTNKACVTPLVFGCFLLGTPIHTLDASFEEHDLMHMFKITKPKLVFCESGNLKTIQNSLESLNINATILSLGEVSVLDELFEPLEAEKSYRPPYLGNSDTTLAVIVCSSGSTGFPKAVCLSHSQLIAPHSWTSHLGDHILLCFSSLYWISAFHMLMATVLNGGKRITTSKPFSAQYAYRLIEKYQVSYVFTPPSLLAEMVEFCEPSGMRLPSLKIVGCGGSSLPGVLKDRANALLKPTGQVYVGYSMSEFGAVVAIDLFGKPNSAGVLMPNVSARIADDSESLLGPEQEGEIQILYTHPFIGYYGNEEATRALLTEDGFIRTGDIGRFDDEGYLTITDRKKEMIRYRGYQIAPAELEALLLAIEGIRHAAVVAIPDPVPPHVDFATALLVKNQQTGCSLEEEEILSTINSQVPDYKKLRGGVYFVDSLPRTANGKVNRREAKKLALKVAQLEK
ncbi:probable 4-coumarate--CoA ligase 1 [Uranotaenia lowii]|uniref:probable 4-coumarate--CoA ligase 1 n=1 Tax=Uranotaenia lowii TaxID=190385 RepID=UPI00247B1785|nr:probable 4-coumarate--CoA ligase 1 [Uranotaenia lowii]